MFGIFYIQSAFSMLNNTMPLNNLIKTLKNKGYDFVALSDQQLYGAYQLFSTAKKLDIKPILGLEVNVVDELFETTFLIYVKSQVGYGNLLKLSFLKSTRQLSLADLINHQKGLIIISSGKKSIIDQHLLKDEINIAYQDVLKYKEIFDDFYLGLSLDTFDQEFKVAPKLFEISEKTKVLLCPIHQSSYFENEDQEAYIALTQIENKDKVVDSNLNQRLLSKAELEEMFADYPFVFDTAKNIANSIEFELEFPKYDMPVYDTKGSTSDAYLKALAIKGLKKRLESKTNYSEEAYQQRLLYELKVIHQMGYDQYFLIVFDFVRFAKQNDILVGPGRGSAAGSLVSYCLGITDIDPLEYDLLFERFLNPERITMPDIDMDFPDNKRDQVLKYVQEKYGKNHVISIITFGSFAVKSSIRDIARVMDIDHQRVTGMIKRVENDDVDESDEEVMRLLSVSKKIEGLPRHTGTHAAGIILARQDLSLSIPLQLGSNDFYQSQFEASDLEKLGLLKIDFLGIRNLAIIHETIELITNHNHKFELSQIPLNDPKVYKLLSVADTFGVFQLESSGMRNVLRKYEPKTFEDIIALLALFRPGPMDLIDDFIERKNGAKFEYLHKDLEPILSSTYGIIVYQEQIMKIANEFAGYSLAEADILRRGIAKKNLDILEEERKRFISKCISKNYSSEVAETIYDYIVKFADYGFNRSHSVSYALVAYQMAYLKVNYYEYFMTVLLSHAIGNDATTYEYITDLKRHQIKVITPDINLSTQYYQLTNQGVLMPLNKIKSIGSIQVEKLLEVRKEGPFKDYQDFKDRVKSILNQKNIEMLIYAGALKSFNLNQRTLYEHRSFIENGYERFIEDFQMKTYEEFSFVDLAEHESEAIGFNLNYNIRALYSDIIKNNQLLELKDMYEMQTAKVLAVIKKVKEIKTKNNTKMAFVTLDDGISQVEATMFSETYKKYQSLLNDEVKIFELKQNNYQNKLSFIVEKIVTLEQL